MAWTDPRTWTAGELVTASLMNTHLRDNLRQVSYLLGRASYNPAATSTYTRTSSTPADVDSTNLSVAFTVPQSGVVLVRFVARCKSAATTSWLRWNVRESTSDLGTAQGVTRHSVAGYHAADCIISGLTPNASKTYKWGFASSDNATTVTMYAGGSADEGPAVMEVWAVV